MQSATLGAAVGCSNHPPYLAEDLPGRNSHASRPELTCINPTQRRFDHNLRTGTVQMLGIHDLWLFVVSGLVLSLAPGPDMAYVVARTAQFGWRGGAIATFGISTGCLVHVLGCSIGLSALLAASATAFALVKWAGAAYLCFIGIKMLLTRESLSSGETSADARAMPLSKVFWQGALTDALNPKVALFFLAFLPQFVSAEAPHQALAFLLLGTIFVINGTFVCLAVAALSAKAASRMRGAGRLMGWINRSLGGMFLYLGARMAMLSR
jgi:threonine/homoserine/homoserine lactone efflux protein